MNYEEVIKNVKELSNLAEWYESDVISGGYEEAKKHREDMTQRVIKFIEKEHELLGLYRKQKKCPFKLHSAYQVLEYQIKALEEELT